MFGAKNVVRPSPRGGKGGRPIQAPMRSRRRGTVKPSTQARLFDPRMQGRINKVGGRSPARGRGRGTGMLATGRGRAVRGGPVRPARRPQYKRR